MRHCRRERLARAEWTMTNDELRQLYERDQEGRRSRLSAWRAVRLLWEDALRRRLVRQLVAQGLLQTGEDYYHAAMLLRHSLHLADYWHAHLLAQRAVDLGYRPARWLFAATLDRWRGRLGASLLPALLRLIPRDVERRHIAELLLQDDVRLVSVVGAPGAGMPVSARSGPTARGSDSAQLPDLRRADRDNVGDNCPTSAALGGQPRTLAGFGRDRESHPLCPTNSRSLTDVQTVYFTGLPWPVTVIGRRKAGGSASRARAACRSGKALAELGKLIGSPTEQCAAIPTPVNRHPVVVRPRSAGSWLPDLY